MLTGSIRRQKTRKMDGLKWWIFFIRVSVRGINYNFGYGLEISSLHLSTDM